MRICELHRERAIDTLVSRKDGTEYDLCSVCIERLHHILNGYGEELLNNGPSMTLTSIPNEKVKSGTRRRGTRKTTDGAPKESA